MSDNAALIAERDALAEDLKTRWPVLASEMVDLIRRVVGNGPRCRAAGIDSAESVARNAPDSAFDPRNGGAGDPHAHVLGLAQAVIPLLHVYENPNWPATVWPGH